MILEESELQEEYLNKINGIARHIKNVQENGLILAEKLIKNNEVELARRLVQRCFAHDNSKFSSIEWDFLGSEEKDKLKIAVNHHRATNSHHPEFHIEGIRSMNDLDLAEMVCDWKSRASEMGSSLREWIKDSAMLRYDFKVQSPTYKKIKKYVDLLLGEPMKKV